MATQANIAECLDGMRPGRASSATVRNIFKSEDGVMLAYGDTVPTAATAGYAKGCIFIHEDGSAGGVLHVNNGSATSSLFVPVSAVAPIDFSTTSPGTETSGSLISTGTNWISFSTAGACGGKLLLRNTCATGEFATWRMRASANNTTASGNGGNSVGTTTCIDASASAIKAEYGNLCAVNACAQPNALAQTEDATNIVTALYGRIDATAASVGRRWVGWLDTHATTTSDASDYMLRISHNGTVAIDGMMTVYGGGRLPIFLNVEDATPGFVGDSTGVTTISKHLVCSINGTPYYIPLCTGTT